MFSNEKGNIAIAMVMVTVGLASSLTLTLLALANHVSCLYDTVKVQQIHIARSESVRGQRLVEVQDYQGESFVAPSKIYYVGSMAYNPKTKIVAANVATGGGLYFTKGYNIHSLITTKVGKRNVPSNLDLVVKTYGVKSIKKTSIAGYHYFTDNESSVNNTPVYFYGPDVINGKVHSNSDIHIRNFNGWPTFLGTVYTTGVIVPHNGTPDMQSVFRQGYYEHVGRLEFNPTADLIRAHGQCIGSGDDNPNKILFVTLSGNNYSAKLGTIIDRGRDSLDVWQTYPPRNGNYLFANSYNKVDTVWTDAGTGSIAGTSGMVHSQLWLKGNVSGKQTWGSAYNTYLVDDISYTGTPLGSDPVSNRNDMLGIVSEKKIIIQYGYKDPADSLRKRPNCPDIYIYGALCALGDGYGNSHEDGVFEFQYQHPHPSTPAVRLGANPFVWDKIDLHRRHYPQTSSHPWPAAIDFPWYNPLWPERLPYMERGLIHLWGSVAQRRRGYVHRNISDSDYPNPQGVWDTPNDLCGGPSGMAVTDQVLGFTGQGINTPGTTGAGVGYNKDYRFDDRLSFTQPPDYPEVHVQGSTTPFEGSNWIFRSPRYW